MFYENPLQSISIAQKAFVFGGAYGNFQATKAILAKAEELGFKKSEIIFTGDMIAYCAQPVETVELISSSVDHIIMGNCEEAISIGSSDCGCGFEEASQCSILSNQWYNYCRANTDMKTAQWMGTLPRFINAKIGNFNFLVTHATPNSINQFAFPSNLENIKDVAGFDGYLVGHSGIPFVGTINNKPWVNSGACGMPANDGTSRIWYATIEQNIDDFNTSTLTVEIKPLEYDYKLAIDIMRIEGLANGYMDCLKSGIWPSHDVLPPFEKAQTGITLKAQKKIFKKAQLQSPVL